MEKSIVHVFSRTAEQRHHSDALRYKEGGSWRAVSWKEYLQRVRRAGRGLMQLGLEAGGTVAIIGGNRWEWLVTDIGIMAAGGVPAPIYSNSTPEQAAYVADHCEATIAVVENETQRQKLYDARDRIPRLANIVLMDGGSAGDPEAMSFEALLALGDTVPEEDLDARLDALTPETLATLIYTSGTTGVPKGVMLNHHNLVFTAQSTVKAFGVERDETIISYLPLSHIAEQMMSIHFAATIGAEVCFAESIDTLGDDLREVRPTVFLGVPRVWEKIQAKISEAGAQSSPLKKKIAAWARRVGLDAGYRRQQRQPLPWTYPLANQLVFSKVRARLGMDRCRIPVVTAAPVAKSTLEFFLSLGLCIYEVYGMSESTGPATAGIPSDWKTGGAGKPIPDTEVKIAEDGEVCLRGGHVFQGYLKMEAETAETIDSEGWLHSGDVGVIDADGHLKITDRKKELIITAGGKNVAPQAIEGRLKAIDGVSLVAVVGDRQKYLSALLTLDPEAALRVAKACGASGRSVEALATDSVFHQHLQAAIDAINAKLARYETIKKFTVLPRDFSVETGELTPTLKLKRRIIAEKYAGEIAAMFLTATADNSSLPGA